MARIEETILQYITFNEADDLLQSAKSNLKDRHRVCPSTARGCTNGAHTANLRPTSIRVDVAIRNDRSGPGLSSRVKRKFDARAPLFELVDGWYCKVAPERRLITVMQSPYKRCIRPCQAPLFTNAVAPRPQKTQTHRGGRPSRIWGY